MERSEGKPRRKWSKVERDELVARWRASGTTVRQFAAEAGVPTSSMYQWLRTRKVPATTRKRGQRSTPSKARARKPGFAEVSVVGDVAARGPTMTVALRSGDSVTFEGAPVEVGRLAAVLKVVRAC